MRNRVYIAATRQNDGKTIVSLGLISALREKLSKVGYMKPVGQQYRIVDNKKIDKDAVLMKRIFDLEGNLSDMSPIAIPKGFTEKYILKGNRLLLVNRVRRSFSRLNTQNDFVVLEGTGHAGVGSVFDMSNSVVAKLLKSRVVIVSCGGIGRPIDEIMLNKSKFDRAGVEVIGVIVNKVHRNKYRKINRLIRKCLERRKVNVLGVVPYDHVLSSPTVSELLEDLDGKLLCGEKGLDKVVERFVIGDVIPHEAPSYFRGGTLLITPGNREDFIFSALSSWVFGITKKYYIAGIIATYGSRPSRKMVNLIARTNIPLILVKEDSFSTAQEINNMIFKLRADDKPKIEKTEKLIEQYVDIDWLYRLIRRK